MRNVLTKTKSFYQGFTLIELVAVVAIVGILSSVGVPSFISLINEYRLTSQANDMIASLNLARSTSIKTRQNVTIRKVANWNDGWRIFIDANNNDTEDGGDTLLKAYPASGNNVTITGANFTNFISYNPNGRANNTGNFTFCPPSSVDSSRRVVVLGSGRMRTTKGNYAANCP